jgi:hypothetical protein
MSVRAWAIFALSLPPALWSTVELYHYAHSLIPQ